MVQVTPPPFLIRTVGALKAKFCMETVAGFGVATGVMAGVLVFTGVIVLATAFCMVFFCANVCGSCSRVGVTTSLDMAGVIDGVVGCCTTATFFEVQALNMASDIIHSPTSEIFFIK